LRLGCGARSDLRRSAVPWLACSRESWTDHLPQQVQRAARGGGTGVLCDQV